MKKLKIKKKYPKFMRTQPITLIKMIRIKNQLKKLVLLTLPQNLKSLSINKIQKMAESPALPRG